MDHFQHIYCHKAREYHRVIVPEDADHHLLPALLRVAPLAGKRILDLGSGTGRIPLLLAPLRARVVYNGSYNFLSWPAYIIMESETAWKMQAGEVRIETGVK